MKSQHSERLTHALRVIGVVTAVTLFLGLQPVNAQIKGPDLAAMPEVKPGNAAMIELGKYFFFDRRLSETRFSSHAATAAIARVLGASSPTAYRFSNSRAVLPRPSGPAVPHRRPLKQPQVV